jgi:hypothetical protein
MTQLYNSLSSCELAGGNQSINSYLDPNRSNDGLSYHLQDRIERTAEYQTDTYKLTWEDAGLNVQDQRILMKILRKDFQDCGRKRGAILRYIKHFKKEQDLTGFKLYQTCQNQN